MATSDEHTEQRPSHSWPRASVLLLAWSLAGAVPAVGAALLGPVVEDIAIFLLIASTQMLVLRWYRLPSAGWWVPATLAGTFAAGIAVFLLFLLLVDPLLGGAGRLGHLLWGGVWGGGALAQARVLAHSLGRSRPAVPLVWVPAGAVGGFLVNLAVSSQDAFLFRWLAAGVRQPLTPDTLAWAAGGALYGIVTAAALLWLVRPRSR